MRKRRKKYIMCWMYKIHYIKLMFNKMWEKKNRNIFWKGCNCIHIIIPIKVINFNHNFFKIRIIQ